MRKDPPTIGTQVSIAKAAKEFNKRHATAMTVVDEDGKLVGIVTPTDLCRMVGSPIVGTTEYDSVSVDTVELHADSPISQIMTTRVIHVSPHDTVKDAVNLMTENKIHNLPVLEDGEVVGLLSQREVLRYLNDLLEPPEEE